MSDNTVRGMYCLRCSSRRVVRGQLGEAARFYPARSAIKALFGQPVFLSKEHSHACLECGLAWNEVDPVELRKNLKKWGMVKHSTVVMEAVQSDAPPKGWKEDAAPAPRASKSAPAPAPAARPAPAEKKRSP